jgi:hypothetical protein
LDAVVSQSTSQTAEANVAAMTLALSNLIADRRGDDDATPPDMGDLAGSAVVCIAWLANRLAASSSVDVEGVVAELRAFIDSASEPRSA